MKEKLMTIPEVAEYLNVKPSTISGWIETNEIDCPYYMLNGKKSYRFKRKDINNIIRKVNCEKESYSEKKEK